MSYVKNGTPIGGTALPTASAAGELPVSDGAGTAYTATSAGDVLALGMVAALAGEPAGAALISDGAGDIATTSADVSAMLAASDAAAARAAMGVPGSVEVDPLTGLSGGLQTWVAVPSSGSTESISGGVMSFNTPAGQTSGTARMSYYRPFGVEAARGVDVAVRIASWGAGAAGTLRGILALGSAADPLNATYTGSVYGIQVYVTADTGVVSADEYLAGSFTTRLTSGAGAAPLGGTGWLRVVTTAYGYAILTGVGATYAAAVWTVRASVPFASPDTNARDGLRYASVGAYRAGTSTGAFAVTYADFRVTGQ